MTELSSELNRLAALIEAKDFDGALAYCRSMAEKPRYVDSLAFETPLRDLRNGLVALELVWCAISEGHQANDEEAGCALRFIQEALEAPLEAIGELTGL